MSHSKIDRVLFNELQGPDRCDTLKDLGGVDGEDCPLRQPVGLIGATVNGNAIVDGDGALIAEARRVDDAERQLADSDRFQQIHCICRS